jgi:hypothetical protein
MSENTSLFPTPQERLEGLRGRDYYTEFNRIMAELGPAIKAKIAAHKAESDDFKLGALVVIADAHGLPFKPLVLWLERQGVIHTGVWDELERNGFSLKKMREHLRERGDL